MKYKYLSLLLFFVFSNITAQIGTLDTTFGNSGIVIQSEPQFIISGCVRPDGKIIMLSQSGYFGEDVKMYVTQYNPDGSLDNTFAVNGQIATAPEELAEAVDMELQPDGKLLIAYYKIDDDLPTPSKKIARYNLDGTLDITFGTAGIVTYGIGLVTNTRCISLQNDKILITTLHSGPSVSEPFKLIRLNADGSPDETFGVNGFQPYFQQTGIYACTAIFPNGDIIVGGIAVGKLAIQKFHADGTPDSGFGVNGQVKFDFFTASMDEVGYGVYKIVPLPDGKLLAYYNGNGSGIVCVNQDGSVDLGFSDDGRFEPSDQHYISDFYVRPDGKIITIGGITAEDPYFVVGKLTANGNPDTSFTDNSYIYIDPTLLSDYPEMTMMQPNGKVIVAGRSYGGGETNTMLMRFTDEALLNTPDNTKDTIKLFPNPFTESITIPSEIASETFRLYDTNGKLVYENQINADENTISPNVSSGLYLYEIEKSNGQKITGKIVKK